MLGVSVVVVTGGAVVGVDEGGFWCVGVGDVVVGVLERVVVVVVGGVDGAVPREIFAGDEWNVITPTRPATVPNMMNGARFI